MADLLIRNVPDDVVAIIDFNAKRLGLSRAEYLRRQLVRDIAPPVDTVTVEDLSLFAETFDDLGDTDVMAQAWR